MANEFITKKFLDAAGVKVLWDEIGLEIAAEAKAREDAIAKELDINPVPFLITEILASNIGGTATLIGDPPNIIIGSAAGFSFMDFINKDINIFTNKPFTGLESLENNLYFF